MTPVKKKKIKKAKNKNKTKQRLAVIFHFKLTQPTLNFTPFSELCRSDGTTSLAL